MISMRNHIVSIAAIFLALALGIVLGATKINSPLVVGLQSDRDSISAERDQLSADNKVLAARVAGDDKFAGDVGNLAVRGTLPAATVLLISTADASAPDLDAIASLLTKAGAKVTGQLQLTAALTDPGRADDLRNLAARNIPAGAKLPEVADVGATTGAFLASVLITDKAGTAPAKADQATTALSALAAAGFVNAPGPIEPARLVVIVTGAQPIGGSEMDRSKVIMTMAAGLKAVAGGVVVAGRTGSETATGAVGVIRADSAASGTISTVDDVDVATGRVAAVLALVEQNGGGAGKYGVGNGSQSQIPALGVN